jgi:tRNA(adenine34) deaminase
MKQNEIFMNMALQEARDAYDEGEIPVGAVLTCNGHLVATAHNQTERLTDITAHAEMLVLTAGMDAMHSKFLSDCNLYVTLEPCIMCAGAIGLARIKQLHFAAFDEKRGYRKYSEHVLHPKTEVMSGLMELDSSKLLKKFFRERRSL